MNDQEHDNRGIPTIALVVISILLSLLLVIMIVGTLVLNNLQQN
jgi:hypothetical protein